MGLNQISGVMNGVDEPKLHIRNKKYTGESTIISMRMPKDMLKEIDGVAEFTGRTRNEIMMMALEFALEHMEVENESKR